MTATEVLRMALHFVFKTDIQAACNYQNAGNDTVTNIQNECQSDWSNGKYRASGAIASSS